MRFSNRLLFGLMMVAAGTGALASIAGLGERFGAADAEAIHATHGVSVGDVSADSAVIWSRANQAGFLHVELPGTPYRLYADARHVQVPVTDERDFTGKVRLADLEPGTEYRYRLWFTGMHGSADTKSAVIEGRFRTAPAPDAAAPLHFTWSGDLGGQNTCRDAQEGYPIFSAIDAERADFFIGLGDMIYADDTCQAVGRYGNAQIPGEFTPSVDMDNYWAHWKYNREDPGYQRLLAGTPYFAIWDDHEVVNDFGPLHDTRSSAPYTPDVHLMPLGLDAFLDYNPVAEHPDMPKRLYRSVRWGRQLELFILDTRQYRDANAEADRIEHPKSMLGREQTVWLKERLQRSDATWKVIVSSVPLSIPTGSHGLPGHDGRSNHHDDSGFEHELIDLLRFMQQNGVRNIAFLTTDVHFAQALRYTPFSDDPGFQVHEFVVGPLNAWVFPNRTLDPTLNPESLFVFGPDHGDDVTTWEQAKAWFNYGSLQIDADGRLTAQIKDVNGDSVYALEITPDLPVRTAAPATTSRIAASSARGLP